MQTLNHAFKFNDAEAKGKKYGLEANTVSAVSFLLL